MDLQSPFILKTNGTISLGNQIMLNIYRAVKTNGSGVHKAFWAQILEITIFELRQKLYWKHFQGASIKLL